MGRLNTFYMAPSRWREPYFLDEEETHHAVRVLRAKPGEQIRVFDGQGRQGLFQLTEIGKRQCHLELLRMEDSPPAVSRLTLAVGWSKGLRRGYLLEKAVEMNARAIWFWRAKRSQGDFPVQEKTTWERQLIAAAKQCGRICLPEIRLLPSVEDVVSAAAAFPSKILCWEKNHSSTIHPQNLAHPAGTVAVIGPEGGIEDSEAHTFLNQGFSPKNLGPHILRFETAALFLLSLHLWATQAPSQLPPSSDAG